MPLSKSIPFRKSRIERWKKTISNWISFMFNFWKWKKWYEWIVSDFRLNLKLQIVVICQVKYRNGMEYFNFDISFIWDLWKMWNYFHFQLDVHNLMLNLYTIRNLMVVAFSVYLSFDKNTLLLLIKSNKTVQLFHDSRWFDEHGKPTQTHTLYVWHIYYKSLTHFNPTKEGKMNERIVSFTEKLQIQFFSRNFVSFEELSCVGVGVKDLDDQIFSSLQILFPKRNAFQWTVKTHMVHLTRLKMNVNWAERWTAVPI